MKTLKLLIKSLFNKINDFMCFIIVGFVSTYKDDQQTLQC